MKWLEVHAKLSSLVIFLLRAEEIFWGKIQSLDIFSANSQLAAVRVRLAGKLRMQIGNIQLR